MDEKKSILFDAQNLLKDEDVEEFDEGFPPKEKLKLPGQIF